MAPWKINRWCLVLVAAYAATLGCGRQKAEPTAARQLSGESGRTQNAPLPVLAARAPSSTAVGLDYFPLTSPSKLEYRVTYRFLTIGSGEGKAVLRVRGRREVEGHPYIVHEITLSGTPVDSTQETLYRPTPEGILARCQATNKEAMLLPNGLAVGSQWLSAGPVSCQGVAVEDVRCGDALYRDCVKIALASGSGPAGQYRWLARGIGLVKLDLQSKLLTLGITLTHFER